jgi:hypothetical protein
MTIQAHETKLRSRTKLGVHTIVVGRSCADTETILGTTVLGYYLAAVTDLTEITSPLAVPVTLASSQASLSSSSRLVLFEVSRV